jgi:AraC family transcriptional regulator, transcriptional activator of pobA
LINFFQVEHYIRMKQIPQYKLDQEYHTVHRIEETSTDFGYNKLHASLRVKDFEIYSTEGLAPGMGPLRSAFYRIGLTIRGGCDVQLGLEQYRHRPGTVNCTIPNQLFSKSNVSADAFGYYVLFNPGFLDSLIPDSRFPEEFPFFSFSGVPFFHLEQATVDLVESLLLRINDELQQHKPGNETAIRLYLYLILLELKRTYQIQKLGIYTDMPDSASLMIRFRKLVNQHYLDKQQVADYADMLHVTPNHLNRTIKDISGKTASDHISEMIMQEAKALLKYTDLSVSEIAWRLQFSEPSSFSRFFRKEMARTPLDYRANA